MVKLLPITTCYQCKHYENKRVTVQADFAGNTYDNIRSCELMPDKKFRKNANGNIPKWCLLEEAAHAD